MVLLLEEADDPNAKLLPSSGPPVNRVPVDESYSISTSDTTSVSELTNESDAETILVTHDPPPSYMDVQGFRSRLKSEQAYGVSRRTRRRFCLALSIALLLCTLPGFITLSIKLSTRSQNEIPKESPSLTTTAAQPSDTSTSQHPNPSSSVPWNEPHYPGGGGRGPDDDRRPPPPPKDGEGGGGDHPGRGPGDHPKPRPGDGGGPPRFPGEGRRPEYPPPDQPKDSFECFDWTEGVDPSLDSEEIVWTVSHNLRLDAPLFIRSYFNKAHGSLRVSLDDQLEEGTAALRVTASRISGDDVRYAKVCFGQMRDHTSVLQLKPTKHVAEIGHYDISLSLPYHRFMYPGIDTHLPGFSHAFDDLSLVDFDFITLDGADAEISAISLSARMLTVHSMGGSIIGKFAATRRLDISGTSTDITVSAHVCDDGQSFPTTARLVTSRKSIDAKLMLCDASETWSHPDKDPIGRYDVQASNSDAPLSLLIEHASPVQGSSLHLNVTNRDNQISGSSNTMVTFDPGFEGQFAARSLGNSSKPVAIHSEEASDGEGGIRYLEIDSIEGEKRTILGRVFWETPKPAPINRRQSEVSVSAVGGGEVSLTFLGD